MNNTTGFWLLLTFSLGAFGISGVAVEAYVDKISEERISHLTEIETRDFEITSLSSKVSAYEQTEENQKTFDYINPIHHEDYISLTSPKGLRDIPSGIYTGGATTRVHEGIDLKGTWHARVVSVSDGVVKIHYPPPGWHKGRWYNGHDTFGGYTVILNDDGTESEYAHQSSTYVKEGQRVKQGEVIGRTGETGLTDGEHLHYEHKINGKSVQPLQYIYIPF